MKEARTRDSSGSMAVKEGRVHDNTSAYSISLFGRDSMRVSGILWESPPFSTLHSCPLPFNANSSWRPDLFLNRSLDRLLTPDKEFLLDLECSLCRNFCRVSSL